LDDERIREKDRILKNERMRTEKREKEKIKCQKVLADYEEQVRNGRIPYPQKNSFLRYQKELMGEIEKLAGISEDELNNRVQWYKKVFCLLKDYPEELFSGPRVAQLLEAQSVAEKIFYLTFRMEYRYIFLKKTSRSPRYGYCISYKKIKEIEAESNHILFLEKQTGLLSSEMYFKYVENPEDYT
jgi:hypothetical protein